MILLKHEILIDTTAEQIFNWLSNLPENYLFWHKDHEKCIFLKGNSIMDVGSVLYIEEYIHGKLHKFKLRVTKLIPNYRLEYKGGLGIKGSFEVRPEVEGTLFVSEISLGIKFPLLEWFSNIFIYMFFREKIIEMRKHMIVESNNLKRILET